MSQDVCSALRLLTTHLWHLITLLRHLTADFLFPDFESLAFPQNEKRIVPALPDQQAC
jgi:hypothetical protein